MTKRQVIIVSAFLSMFFLSFLSGVSGLLSLSRLMLLSAGFSLFVFVLINYHRSKAVYYDAQAQSLREKLNLLTAELKQKEEIAENLPHQVERLNFFKTLTENLIPVTSLCDVYDIAAQQIRRTYVNASLVLIYLYKKGKLELAFSLKISDCSGSVIKQKHGDVLDLWCLRHNQELLIKDLNEDFRFDRNKVLSLDERYISSVISSPMTIGGKAVGLIRVESAMDNAFSYDDLRILSAIADISALAIDRLLLFSKVEELAIKDSLTGLYVKGYFMERMKEELHRSGADSVPVSIAIIDIDNFKDINDQKGHMVGDMVIKKIAHIIHTHGCRNVSVACRFGGEEFVLLVPGTGKERAMIEMENLRLRIESEPLLFRRRKVEVTVSIGLASYPADGRYCEELLKSADEALYSAKRKGRNRVCPA